MRGSPRDPRFRTPPKVTLTRRTPDFFSGQEPDGLWIEPRTRTRYLDRQLCVSLSISIASGGGVTLNVALTAEARTTRGPRQPPRRFSWNVLEKIGVLRLAWPWSPARLTVVEVGSSPRGFTKYRERVIDERDKKYEWQQRSHYNPHGFQGTDKHDWNGERLEKGLSKEYLVGQ